jgi:hypothetical protein
VHRANASTKSLRRRSTAATEPAAAHDLLRLQATAGNAAVAALIQREAAADVPSAAASSPAAELIAKHTWGPNLNEEALGKELADGLPANASLAYAVLDVLPWTDRDDVALAICEAADDEAIKRIAVDVGGKAVLLRVVRELEDGYTTGGERAEMQRVLKLVSEVASEMVEGPSGSTIEVEVITFLHGGATLDVIGTTFFGKGTKGHTAVIVGGLAYSYEDGWQTGQTKDEYLAKNSWRPGIGQVLEISLEDARKIQLKLNESANEGVYFLGGDICTDATARALEEVLGDLKSGFDVQGFPAKLDATGKVRSRRDYPAHSAPGDFPLPAGDTVPA